MKMSKAIVILTTSLVISIGIMASVMMILWPTPQEKDLVVQVEDLKTTINYQTIELSKYNENVTEIDLLLGRLQEAVTPYITMGCWSLDSLGNVTCKISSSPEPIAGVGIVNLVVPLAPPSLKSTLPKVPPHLMLSPTTLAGALSVLVPADTLVVT